MCNSDVILCVDDEENQLTMRKYLLESKGYSVLAASSGQQALDFLECHQIDLVLSDHLMPGLTGAELARQIKLHTPELPVILISALNEIPAGAEYADLFMSKLDGPVAMCRNIALMLEQSRNRSLR
jgi:two-component system, OmpR family, response regulator CpxR